ncbi:hypothetical protein GA0116948_1362 [Chitinophaga costaii]|uniref:Uncharacterized protein n=1 Tax=Chitinophaga costaii TaxID=1335309 RepID=A0A1C4G906_9BACT|nr:hypothetical protein GA0116948_1362 [Chitinophaga costaii]
MTLLMNAIVGRNCNYTTLLPIPSKLLFSIFTQYNCITFLHQKKYKYLLSKFKFSI